MSLALHWQPFIFLLAFTSHGHHRLERFVSFTFRPYFVLNRKQTRILALGRLLGAANHLRPLRPPQSLSLTFRDLETRSSFSGATTCSTSETRQTRSCTSPV